jgi:hypothetical protein
LPITWSSKFPYCSFNKSSKKGGKQKAPSARHEYPEKETYIKVSPAMTHPVGSLSKSNLPLGNPDSLSNRAGDEIDRQRRILYKAVFDDLAKRQQNNGFDYGSILPAPRSRLSRDNGGNLAPSWTERPFTKPSSLMGIVNKLPGSVNFLMGENLSILKT